MEASMNYFLGYLFKIQEQVWNREDRKIRENLSEKKIDKMIADSFPASDPPSTY